MNERELGGKIVRQLNVGLKNVDELTASRLKAARLRALDRAVCEEPVRSLAIAGHDGHPLSDFFAHRRSALLAPVVAILLAAAVLFVWNSGNQVPDQDDVDLSLLTGDLPIDAYLDRDFTGWQKVSSP